MVKRLASQKKKSSGLPAPKKIHSVLGASSAHIWMECPGSIQFCEQFPDLPQTEPAARGTAAHELAQTCLENGTYAVMHYGDVIADVEIDEQIVEQVEFYCEVVKEELEGASIVFIEHMFNLSKLKPVRPMFGTNDAGGFFKKKKLLKIIDLKTGAVWVNIIGNKQTRYYAAGMMLDLMDRYDIEEIEMVIVQPNEAAGSQMVRREVLTRAELWNWIGELMEAARETVNPNAALVPGTHCTYCKGTVKCAARAQNVTKSLNLNYDDVVNGKTFTLPNAESLTPEQIGHFLRAKDRIDKFFNALHKFAYQEIRAGTEAGLQIGFKEVPKKGRRIFTNKKAAARKLMAAGLKKNQVLKVDVASPAQAEKFLGKKTVEMACGHLIKMQRNGTTIAPLEDRREAVGKSLLLEFDKIDLDEDDE